MVFGVYVAPIGHQTDTVNPAAFFMQNSDYQSFELETSQKGTNAPHAGKPTHRPPGGVGEEWPALLSKKWLAARYQCIMANGSINRRRFRMLVLTEEVLTRAGIPMELAYSRSTKTFNAIHSMSLTKILRGFCLALLLTITYTATAQTVANVPPANAPVVLIPPVHVPVTDLAAYTIYDTIPGTLVVSDSTIRMIQVRPGEYKYQAVLSTIVFSGYMVKEVQIEAGEKSRAPKLLGHRFYHEAWGMIDPKRVLLFKTNQ